MTRLIVASPTGTRRPQDKGIGAMLMMVSHGLIGRSFVWVVFLVGCMATGARGESASGAEVHIVDLNLRLVVERALGIQPGYAIRPEDIERLLAVDVSGSAYDVLELTGLEFAVNLQQLDLRGNRIVDLSPLAGLQRLNRIELDDNNITDISPLTANESIGLGDQVFLAGNPLGPASVSELIPELESRGAYVAYRDDHGDAISTATSLPLGGASSGGIGTTLDADYFGFEVSSASDVAVFTTGASTRGDLLTGAEHSLASDSTSGAFDNFLIRQHLQPGRYYVRVTGARGPYMLHTVEGAPVRLRDFGLRALVGAALGDAARDGVSSTELATFTGALDGRSRGIYNLGGLEFAVNLTGLRLSRNRLGNLTPLSSLVSLAQLDLERASVTDVASLVANPGLDAGDKLFLGGNALSDEAVNVGIPALERRGVFVGRTDDYGDDLDDASPIALGTTVSASIYPARDRDVFAFQLTDATDVVIYATGDVDTAGVLYDAQGRERAAYDGDPGNAKIARALDAGDYHLQVRAADESIRGPYVVHVHVDPNVGILPDSNLRTVVAAALNKPPEAAITAVDLATMTSLQAAGGDISDLTGLELAVNLTNVDLSHNRVVSVEPLSGLNALRELRLVDNVISDLGPLIMNTGLGVGARVFLQGNPLSSPAGSEQVSALAAKGVAVLFADDHSNHRSGATVLDLGSSNPGSIHHEADRDFFRLNLAGRTDVAVFTAGDADLTGTLSDTRSMRVAVDDYRGAGTNFFFRATLGSGSYYVQVDGDGDSLGAYVIHAVADEPARIPDERLLARVALFYSVAADTPVTTGDLASLQLFDASNARISDLAGLDAAFNLRRLTLRHNRIEDVRALSGMTRLVALDLEHNDISDIGALAANGGLGQGDKVILAGNPLDQTALETHLPALEERGVFVGYLDDHGDGQGNATTLAPGDNVGGALSTVDDADVFRIELPEATDIVIYTTGSTNTHGRLSGVAAWRVASDSDSGVGDNFIMRRRLEAGTYYVTVSGSDGYAGVGPYVLHAAVPPTAPPDNITVLRDGSSLVVTWDAVPIDLAGGTITRYRVIATPSDGGQPIGCTASPDAGGCTVVGLADGVDYTVTVQAVNAVGFGPAGGAAAPPDEIVADISPTSFWRGWRLSLAAPPAEDD